MSSIQTRGWLGALGCMVSVLSAGCDPGATLMVPPEQPGDERPTPASPDAVSPDAPSLGEISPDGVSPPATDPTDAADSSGGTDGHGSAPLPSESAAPGAMLPAEGAAAGDPAAPGADASAPGAAPADDSDDPDEPPPDEPPPDSPAPGDPAPGDPSEPDDPDPIPSDPSEPEPVDEAPSPPRDEPTEPVGPDPDLPAPAADEPPPSDEPLGDEPPSDNPSGNHPSGDNPPGGLPSFHISLIGSSTASGFGASSAALAWASLLEASLSERAATPVTVSNLAVGGYTAFDLAPGSGMAGSIDAAIGEKPDLILIALAGSNDLDGTITTGFFISQLVALRDTARAAGIPTFFMGTLPKNFTPDNRQLLVHFDRAMASEFGACWVPGANEPYAPCFIHVFESLADASLGLAPQFDSGDGQHPNDAGHALLFDAADAVVVPYVCSKTACR